MHQATHSGKRGGKLNQEAIHELEQALFKSTRAFDALKGVAFALSQTDGKGPFDWSGDGILQLEAALDVIAQYGSMAAEGGLEIANGLSVDLQRGA